MKKMKDAGIETGIHYKPIHTMKKYRNSISLPITEKIAREIVSIPIHPNLTKNDIERIVKNVNKYSV